ncbi:MAG: UDP-N-acetylmuramoyl-L-alanine--D-glutamate ligase [Gammaproteobacteria bacterium]|nr:UDP-N-acetylmuramoyl-L-alanine--D-glutamate ligase [Gammaproteobacteria bacterium]
MAKTAMKKRALVVGLGFTGATCVRYLLKQGYDVVGVDTRRQPPNLHELQREFPNVVLHTGGLDERLLRDHDLLVVSPGVSLKEPAIAQAIAAGSEVVGDIELFARAAKAPVLAITGANGKSTVTSLVGTMCQIAGLNTKVGGNIGVAALSLLGPREPHVYVLELSSFQLETTSSLNARAATVLNITPDHMDRYADINDYAAAKARIFRGDGLMVLNADDAIVQQLVQPARRVARFCLGEPSSSIDYGLQQRNGETWLVHGDEPILRAVDVPLPGSHNLANVLAALALTDALNVPRAAQVAAVRAFKGLPHRTELVGERDGVRWINDSKGTNVGATAAALNGMTAPVVLIAGGDGKGADFSELKDVCAAHARAVVLIGRDAAKIEAALQGVVPTQHAHDMKEAVRAAHAFAQPGDIVLLSPACASLDMYKNYEHRGATFRAAVEELLR